MIREVSGDILLTKSRAIAHGVAPHDHFTSGLALQLRERWPAMVKDFRHWCHATHPAPGEAWIWGGPDGVRIVNLVTQAPTPDHFRHGRPGRASVEHVSRALRSLAKIAREERLESIALPRLATGVGGLEWAEVRPLLEQHLQPLGIPIIVYSTYRAGVAANEGLAVQRGGSDR